MKLGRLILRTLIGGLFIGHGTQKLFGWFGGNGLEATGGFFETKLGLRPGRRNALAAGAAEAGGGALLAAGLFTPLAATAITGTMITAIRKVHAPKGVWVTNGGMEYNLVLIAAVLALADEGPGALSLDHALGIELSGRAVALAALAGGAAGSAATLWLAERNQPEPEPVEVAVPGPANGAVTPDREPVAH